jgi:hypothetical protein
MGYIKEPEGVDFIIKSEPLTDKERQEISKFIAEYKAKHAKAKPVRKSSKPRQPAV